MALQDIATVNIRIATSSVAVAGFGYPLFVTNGQYFNDRVRAYNSIESVAADIPTNTPTYAACSAFFGQVITPEFIYVGRRDATVVQIAPVITDQYAVSAFTLTTTPKESGAPETISVSYAFGAAETAEDMVDAMVIAITGNADVAAHVSATKVGTLDDAVLNLVKVAPLTDSLSVGDFSNVIDTNTNIATAADTISDIQLVNDEWYFVTLEDKDPEFTVDMADTVEAMKKMLFVASANAENLVANVAGAPIPANDVAGRLQDNGYLRTASMFHDEAGTYFPECAWIGRCAPETPGSITWANKQLSLTGGVPRDPNTGFTLTPTQMNNLSDKNCNLIQSVAGLEITREGKVASGEWIDTVRGVDDLNADMTARIQNLLINKGKVPFTDEGINDVATAVSSSLQRSLDNGFLESYDIKVPSSRDISFVDKATRVFKDLTFVGYLAGAIHVNKVNGVVTYNNN